MSRRRTPKKRYLSADPVYESVVIHMIVNNLLKHGKKTLAYRLLYQSLKEIGEKTDQDPVKIVEQAVENATPSVVVKARRIGGSTYQVPIPINPERGKALGIRWILSSCRSRSGKSMVSKLTSEFLEASKNQGNAIRKKQEVHRMAEANKAFSKNQF